jgi:hypothetical protein
MSKRKNSSEHDRNEKKQRYLYDDTSDEEKDIYMNTTKKSYTGYKRIYQPFNESDDSETDTLTNMFKKVKVRKDTIEKEKTSSDIEEEEYISEQLDRRKALDKCLEFFLLKSIKITRQITNRQGKPTSILVQNYLQTILRRIKNSGNFVPEHIVVYTDMYANCDNLRLLYKHFPQFF